MGQVGPWRLPCSSAILKNYNSREGQKVLQKVLAQMCPQRLPLPFFLQNIPSTVVKATLRVGCV